MALCTAAEVKALLTSIEGTTHDTLLDTLASYADAVLARWCGYPPATAGSAPTLEQATHTLYSAPVGDPRGWGVRVDGDTLHLRIWPMGTVTSIHDDPDRVYGSDYLVDSGDYETDDERGLVILKVTRTHGGWSKSARAIKVVAAFGYSSVPSDMKMAAIQLVAHWFSNRERHGLSNATQAGVSLGLLDFDVPVHVKRIMGQYRLPTAVE